MSASTPTPTQQLDALIDAIVKVVDNSRKHRFALLSKGEISNIYYPLEKQSELIKYVEALAVSAGLSPADTKDIVEAVKDLLAKSPVSPPTVNWLENELLAYAAKLNLSLLKDIIKNIGQYKKNIDNSSAKLKGALDKLSNMNEGFGAIVLFVNLIDAMIKVSSGNFNALAKVIANLP
jgi:hypothetical protein